MCHQLRCDGPPANFAPNSGSVIALMSFEMLLMDSFEVANFALVLNFQMHPIDVVIQQRLPFEGFGTVSAAKCGIFAATNVEDEGLSR